MSDKMSQIMVATPLPLKKRRFTQKQRLFIKYYLESFNGADAARKAGYKVKCAREMAYENLQKPHIAREIKLLCDLAGLTEEEIRHRLGRMARGEIPTKTMIDGGTGKRTDIFDERQALENLARARGMFIDRHQIQALPGLDIIDAPE